MFSFLEFKNHLSYFLTQKIYEKVGLFLFHLETFPPPKNAYLCV